MLAVTFEAVPKSITQARSQGGPGGQGPLDLRDLTLCLP